MIIALLLVFLAAGCASAENSVEEVTELSVWETIPEDSVVIEESVEEETKQLTERELYEQFIQHNAVAVRIADDGEEIEVSFPQNEPEQHAFFDLNGDGIEEMYLQNDHLFNWADSFFTVKDGRIYCLGFQDPKMSTVFSGTPQLTDNHKVVLVETSYVGREHYIIYHLTEDMHFILDDSYSRLWDNYDLNLGSACFRGDEEITLEEYEQTVNLWMSKIVPYEWE